MNSMDLAAHFVIPPAPAPDESMVIRGDQWRIQVLTERLMRVEWSPSGTFEDRSTQLVVNRRFPRVEGVTIRRERSARAGEQITVSTPAMTLHYDGQEFSSHGLYATALMPTEWGAEWRWGVRSERPWLKGQNLRGTCRTLDDVDGRAPLDDGIFDGRGITAIEDTTAALAAPTPEAATSDASTAEAPDPRLAPEDAVPVAGWPTAREEGSHDVYIFAGGWQFVDTIRDYYRLTGAQPILPRWALGNWWSRYHRYSAEEYLALMDRFTGARIPLSVAVIDMDWHLVDLPAEHGSGWTGFTWNRELFPDPEAFLDALKARGLHTALNLHPADGVRSYEEAYERLARALGRDVAAGERIPFTPDDAEFMSAYFQQVLYPLEDQGVGMWWPDWQQGTWTTTPGLDPLWILNHTHVTDNAARHGGRGLTLSRYAGPGSHRYPVGFSGDTVVSWESLAFQPEFTATASNIGYGWWSHDIGGHMDGTNDRELQTRWVQFGVFSPIMRLHSSNNPLMSKEPWRWGVRESAIQAEFMRLRHRLIPYLHSEQIWGHGALHPLITPMYWHHADEDEAWTVPNEYYFGRQLLAAPITQPEDRAIGLARVDVFLPAGQWVDLFAGRSYSGGRTLAMYRPLESFPLLAQAGAILPLAGRSTKDEAHLASFDPCAQSSPALGVENPSELEVIIVAGADGGYELLEDDDTDGGVSVSTRLTWNDSERRLTIGRAQHWEPHPPHDEATAPTSGAEAERAHNEFGDVVPAERSWMIRIYEGNGRTTVHTTGSISTQKGCTLHIPGTHSDAHCQTPAWVTEIAERAQIANVLRVEILDLALADALTALSQVHRLDLPDSARGALVEALTAQMV